jgi:heme/copper-type cytochrome/quinol oxidase subunit 3
VERPIATTRMATGIPTGRLALWWILASEIVIFGGLLASYLMFRLGHPEWADAAAVTNTWIGAFNTFVLLTSSFTAVLAHQAAEKGNGKQAARYLVMTIAGALIFLG